MPRFLALVNKEFLLLRRDWHGLGLLFLLPALFITIMSLAMQGAHELGGERTETVRVVDADDSRASRALMDGLDELGPFTLEVIHGGEAADLTAAIQRREYALGLFIPAGFEDALMAGRPAEDRAPGLDLYYDPGLLPPLRELFVLGLEGGLDLALLATALERLAPGWGGNGRARALLDAQPLNVTATPVYAGDGPTTRPNAVQQSVPAWLVLAMFFVVSPLAGSLIVEREQGTLTRLRQLNVPAAWILGSRLPPYYLINMGQLLLMLLVGIALVPALGGEQLTLGHSPFGLWLIASATSLAAIGFALLVAVLARTAIQATLLGGVVILIMGAIGGVMVPKAVMPPAMQSLSQVSPMSWGLEGFWAILLHRRDWTAVLPESLALLLFGGACWLLAAQLHRHRSY